jgi:hypothetical protein
MRNERFHSPMNDYLLEKKIERIARKVVKESKTKDPRKEITLNQQMLLAHHSGVLDAIRALPNTKAEKVSLLAFMFNSDIDNTRKAFDKCPNLNDDLVKTEANYEFVINNMERLKMRDLASKFEVEYVKFQRRKERKK